MQNNILLSVDQAIKNITEGFFKLDDEDIELTNALGRVTAKPIISRINSPSNNVSSMDGYAINSNDFKTKYIIVGESSAGNPFRGKINPGETVQIFTGSHLPTNTNTVIIQEKVILKNNKYIELIDKNIIKNQHVRKKGLDFKLGDIILKENQILNSRNIGSIAMSGNFWLNVRRRPIIGILSSGNELEKVGELTQKNKIASGNNIMLSSMVKIFGGVPRILPIAEDKKNSIITILDRNLDCDLLLTTGGASVGKYDLLKSVFDSKTQRTKIEFWKIAMRPGKPLIFGLYKNVPLLGLPGNPVSAGVCSLIFLRAAMRKMLGLKNYFPKIYYDIISHKLEQNDERMDFLRASIKYENNRNILTSMRKQDSSMINLFSQSNCLIIRKPFEKEILKGEKVRYIKYPDYF